MAAALPLAGWNAAGALRLSPGHTIGINDEQLLVVGAAPASDRTYFSLSVQRGVNGTEPAVHPPGASLSLFRYPPAITEACLRQAAAWWSDRTLLPFAAPDRAGPPDGLDPTALRLLEPYRRRAAALGV